MSNLTYLRILFLFNENKWNKCVGQPVTLQIVHKIKSIKAAKKGKVWRIFLNSIVDNTSIFITLFGYFQKRCHFVCESRVKYFWFYSGEILFFIRQAEFLILQF